MDLNADLTDATGAASILSRRFNTPYTREALRWLVKSGKVRSLMFNEQGVLVERKSSEKTRGKDLLFLRSDLETLEKPKRGPVSQSAKTGDEKA